VLTVVGEAGLGKTRLLLEFTARAQGQPGEQGARLLRGRALPSSQARPYALLASLLLHAMQAADDESPRAMREHVQSRLVPLLARADPSAAEAHAHALVHLVGLAIGDSPHLAVLRDDPAQLRQRGQHAAWLWLQALLAEPGPPWIVQLEDLHWADDATLRWLQQGLPLRRHWPLFVLALARPSWYERHPQGLLQGQETITLAPLDAAQRQHLAQTLLRPLAEPSPALEALLVQRAEGNPFFMEELVKMLVDQGAIEPTAASGRWQLRPERLKPDAIPLTLTGVLQARLDSLPSGERSALQEASVLGTVFWDATLAALDAQAPAHLPSLVQRALARAEPDAPVPGWQAYAFSHALLHQVTYGTLLSARRRELHALAARFLAAQHEQGALAQPALVAEHHHKAGEPDEAAHFWHRAAQQASERHDPTTVLTQRALDALPAEAAGPHAALRWQLLLVRNAALVRTGRRERAVLEEMQRLAAGLGDGIAAQTCSQWADWHLHRAEWPAMGGLALSLLNELSIIVAAKGDAVQSLRLKQRVAAAAGLGQPVRRGHRRGQPGQRLARLWAPGRSAPLHRSRTGAVSRGGRTAGRVRIAVGAGRAGAMGRRGRAGPGPGRAGRCRGP
jgi:predicted ATPase